MGLLRDYLELIKIAVLTGFSFELSGLKGPDGKRKRCFPHMLCDMFAVEMLLAGVPLEQISILLGHIEGAAVLLSRRSRTRIILSSPHKP